VSSLFNELCKHYSFQVSCLKPEQVDVVDLILAKRNVLAFYPTGYGKSLMYITPPLLCDLVRSLLYIVGLMIFDTCIVFEILSYHVSFVVCHDM